MQSDDEEADGTSGLIKVKCPYCFKREFLADTAEAANRRLDEHIFTTHPVVPEASDKIYWTASDLKFLKGLRISPL